MKASSGGLLRLTMRGPDGAGHRMTGTFRHVQAPERLGQFLLKVAA